MDKTGAQLFLHWSDILEGDKSGFRTVLEGEKVEFGMERTSRGLKAVGLTRVSDQV